MCLLAGQTSVASNAGLIEASERELRADLAWLADRRVLSLPLTTWPLPMYTLQTALSRVQSAELPDVDRAALERTRRALARIEAPFSLEATVNSARHPSLEEDTSPRARSEVALGLSHFGEATAFRLRLSKRNAPLQDPDPSISVEGSYVGLATAPAVIAFGSPDRWWGPGVFTSPILSDAGPPVPSLVVRRRSDAAPSWAPLEWVGPWGYEVSFGRLQNYTPEGSRTIGLRVFSRPTHWLEVGASRFITWAGEGRPQGPSALFDVLTGRSNTDDPVADPSNELAGLDLRISAPTDTGAWIGYAHIVGEDEANHTPSRLIGTVGTQVKHGFGEHRLEFSAEATDTELGRLFGLKTAGRREPAYRHAVYVDGYFHRGLPIGANVGGGAISLTLGVTWVAPPDSILDRVSFSATEARLNENGPDANNLAFGVPSRMHAASLRIQSAGRVARWHLGVSMQRHSVDVRREVGVIGGVEITLEPPK